MFGLFKKKKEVEVSGRLMKYNHVSDIPRVQAYVRKSDSLPRNQSNILTNFREDQEVFQPLIETNPLVAYAYCMDVRDDKEVRSYISKSNDCNNVSSFAFMYCRDIKDRIDIRNIITNPMYAAAYCIQVKDRPEMREVIKKRDHAIISFCRTKTESDIYKLVKCPSEIFTYIMHIKDRPELHKLCNNDNGGWASGYFNFHREKNDGCLVIFCKELEEEYDKAVTRKSECRHHPLCNK